MIGSVVCMLFFFCPREEYESLFSQPLNFKLVSNTKLQRSKSNETPSRFNSKRGRERRNEWIGPVDIRGWGCRGAHVTLPTWQGEIREQ